MGGLSLLSQAALFVHDALYGVPGVVVHHLGDGDGDVAVGGLPSVRCVAKEGAWAVFGSVEAGGVQDRAMVGALGFHLPGTLGLVPILGIGPPLFDFAGFAV